MGGGGEPLRLQPPGPEPLRRRGEFRRAARREDIGERPLARTALLPPRRRVLPSCPVPQALGCQLSHFYLQCYFFFFVNILNFFSFLKSFFFYLSSPHFLPHLQSRFYYFCPSLRRALGGERQEPKRSGGRRGRGDDEGAAGVGVGRRGRGSPGPTSDHVPGLPRELRHLLQRQQRLPGTSRDLLERRSPAGRAGRCPSPPVPPGAAPSAPGTGVHRHARGAAGASSAAEARVPGGEAPVAVAQAVPGRGAARSRRSVPPPLPGRRHFPSLPVRPPRSGCRDASGGTQTGVPRLSGRECCGRHGLPRAGT